MLVKSSVKLLSAIITKEFVVILLIVVALLIYPIAPPTYDCIYCLSVDTYTLDFTSNPLCVPEDDPNKLTDLKKFNEEAIKREASSFTFDPTGLEFEIAEIGKIGAKYGVIGAEGSVDLDYNGILEAREKEFEAAGLQKIIDAMQTQYDAYLASK